MTFPLHTRLSPFAKVIRMVGGIGIAASALAFAGPAAAQISQSFTIAQPAPLDSSGEFGIHRTLSAEGDTLIVGDMLADTGAGNEGSAYIYDRDSINPFAFNLVATLVAPDGAQNDGFGTSVAISDDGNVAVVGAQGADQSGSESGAAYIFRRDKDGAGAWGFVQKITASDGSAGDIFGAAGITVSGDVIAVAATNDDNAKGTDAGAIYVFNEISADTWSQVAQILPPRANFPSRLLGRGLKLQSNRLVAGSHGDFVFIFERNEGGLDNWGTVATLRASDDATGGQDFGEFAVDLDGDRVVVGARQHNGLGEDSGAAYIYERNGDGSWSETQKIIGSDVAAGWQFGTDVAVEGDLIIIGADARDRKDRRIGAAYVYRPGPLNGDFEEVSRLYTSNREVASGFGRGVELADGTPLIGAPTDDNSTGKRAGAVFSFDVNDVAEYGDAPAPYPSLAANDGARHLNATSSFALGAKVDVEADAALGTGPQSTDALGDDSSNDDEDGVTLPSSLVLGITSEVSVSFTGPTGSGDQGKLSGWVDFNRDGDWDDAGEQVFNNVTLTNGVNALSIATPNNAVAGRSYARFRLTSAGISTPTGAANDGEVEDYVVQIAPKPQINVRRNVTVVEGDVGTTQIKVAVTLSAPVPYDVSADYATADGGALEADGDYIPATGTFTIPAGETRTFFFLTSNGDTRDEVDEGYRLLLSNPTGATFANPRANIRILDDDAAPAVSFSSAGASFGEGAGRFITVQLSAASGKRLVVPVAITGPATSGADYEALPTAIVFNRGETERRIRIQSIDDATAEPDESFTLTLSGSADVTLGEISQTRFVIRDND